MYPILFTIGPVNVYSYGVMLAIGFLLALHLASRRSDIFDVPKEGVGNLLIVLLVSGIIGARITYVLSNIDFFVQYPLDVFMLNKGGLVFYGGLILSCVSGLVYARKSKLSVLDTADLIAPFIALGHAIGRIGCFLNGCCFGRPTDSILGVCFPNSITKVFPTQLFSSSGLFVIFAFLFYLQTRRRFRGEIISLYLVLYGVLRFFVEFLRGDSGPVLFDLSFSQIISVLSVIVGSTIFYIFKTDE
jgi:phosphatidylglycerol---prolipoprotein diacylglyceryl transferase